MIDIYDHHAISAGEIRIARDRALAALGRLDGTVAGLGGDALAIFARRLVTACVIDALRVERHAFTDDRFAAWRAGIGTLSDGATHHQRSPSRVTRAVLGELATHSWAPLAEAAQAFHDAWVAVGRDADRLDWPAFVDAVLFQVQLLCPWCNELRTKAQNAEGALRALCERVLGGAQPRDPPAAAFVRA